MQTPPGLHRSKILVKVHFDKSHEIIDQLHWKPLRGPRLRRGHCLLPPRPPGISIGDQQQVASAFSLCCCSTPYECPRGSGCSTWGTTSSLICSAFSGTRKAAWQSSSRGRPPSSESCCGREVGQSLQFGPILLSLRSRGQTQPPSSRSGEGHQSSAEG